MSGSRWVAVAQLLTFLALAGCAPPSAPPSDPELRAELGIPDDVAIHRVELVGWGDWTRVLPADLTIQPGDVVQFVTLDHRVYLIQFEESLLAPAAVDFLKDTKQDSPPPLVEQGARLVISFQGAPQASYAYRVEGNGAAVLGSIRVSGP